MSPNNLPRLSRSDYPEGRETGYYSLSYCRYARMLEGAPEIVGFWFTRAAEAERDLDMAWMLEDFYPKRRPVWISCRPSRFELYDVIPSLRQLVCSSRINEIVQESRLSDKLETFECKLYTRAGDLDSPFRYFGVYGAPCGDAKSQEPWRFDPIDSFGFAYAMRNPYVFYYVDSHLPELGEVDLFVGPQGSLFFSEALVKLLIGVVPMLQFDPVLCIN